jgi:DUF177 domain-containing protein
MPATRKIASTHRSASRSARAGQAAARPLNPQGPLVFNTRAISRRPGTSLTEIRTVPAPADLGAGMARIPEGSDLRLDVRLESVSEGVLVTVEATALLMGECARCLEPVAQTLEVRSQELFSYEQDGGEAEDDGYSLDGDLLDLEPALRDALVLALPLAPKCQDDCPGLCVECGARLAQAGPDHRHDSAVDPRWAALRQFKTDTGPDGSPVPETREENGRGRP